MKLKPLGKKLVIYKVLALTGFIGGLLSFHFEWVAGFWLFFICFILGIAQVISISMDANMHKYDYRGYRHGADLLVEYEPSDAEYEIEKGWQNENEPINVSVNIEVKAKELKKEG